MFLLMALVAFFVYDSNIWAIVFFLLWLILER